MRRLMIFAALLALLLASGGRAPLARGQVDDAITLAVIGDYGAAGQPELDVANLVKSWNPDAILTAGDNNYPSGAASTIDQNIGQYYHEFISPYTGAYGAGAASNKFWPALGNHDWNTAGAAPYLAYFSLPGNERYYDVVLGPAHVFVVDSDPAEPDGILADSIQGQWLQARLAASTAPWKIVTMHHAPYSSSSHGSTAALQWPYRTWGASLVIAGHDHAYERIMRDGFPYFVNGTGGAPTLYPFGTPVSGSAVRFNSDYGAMRIIASTASLSITFTTRAGITIDAYELARPFKIWLPLLLNTLESSIEATRPVCCNK